MESNAVVGTMVSMGALFTASPARQMSCSQLYVFDLCRALGYPSPRYFTELGA